MPTANQPRICVFCGSADGADPLYAQTAKELGERMAAAGIGLVYGGATVGLMGILADAVIAGGAEVVGVMPEVRCLFRSRCHESLAGSSRIPPM